MRTNRLGGGGIRRARWAARTGGEAWPRPFLKAQLGALALVAGSFIMASAAQAMPAEEPRQVSAAQQGPLVDLAGDHALLGNTVRGGVPFARHDLAILLVGGAIVTVVAAGAPFLLRPRRGVAPAFATAVTSSPPILPAGGLAPSAHASA